MERLTRKSQISDMVWFVDHENSNMDLEPCEMNPHHNRLAIQKLAAYEDLEERCISKCGCGLNMVIQKYTEFLDNMHELAEYWELEEQGLLLRLPCKVGDTIYKIPSKVNFELNNMHHHPELNRVYEQVVYSVEMFSNDGYFVRTCYGIDGVSSVFYKETWFLTKEEAESALEKLKGEEHE